MKKWFTILCLILVTVCSICPCCQDDDCGNESIASHTDQHPEEDEKAPGICSPFSACTSCAAFMEMEPVIINVGEHEQALPFYNTYHASDLEGIYSSLFQPPRC
ncbi:MAG: hypothetical protein J7527_04930 [Chitinophagaceae bacterium]|nr:hypothetical protein [Chitinophagaceae bacterium]